MRRTKYHALLETILGIMFAGNEVDDDMIYDTVLRFAKKERLVDINDKGIYYLTYKGFKKIRKYLGGEDNVAH